jgi:hypothetical protein
MSPSDIIATSAAIIALLALLATFWQAKIARHHYRLSVRPHLLVDEVRFYEKNGLRLTVAVRNVGFGPAVIEAAFFCVDGKHISPDVSGSEASNAIKLMLKPEFRFLVSKHGLPGVGTALPAGCTDVILEIEVLGVNEATYSAVWEPVDLELCIDYQSLYQERFSYRNHICNRK